MRRGVLRLRSVHAFQRLAVDPVHRGSVGMAAVLQEVQEATRAMAEARREGSVGSGSHVAPSSPPALDGRRSRSRSRPGRGARRGASQPRLALRPRVRLPGDPGGSRASPMHHRNASRRTPRTPHIAICRGVPWTWVPRFRPATARPGSWSGIPVMGLPRDASDALDAAPVMHR